MLVEWVVEECSEFPEDGVIAEIEVGFGEAEHVDLY